MVEAASAADVLQPKHHYDRGRIICNCDDRATAMRLGGHTWNVVTNREEGEVYLRHARSSDHYIDAHGRATNAWFQQKRRIDLDGDGIIDCVDSSNVQEIMRCPPTAGKAAQKVEARQVRQLCQASAPNDYALYSARRAGSRAPPTPGREGQLERREPYQERRRDVQPAATPRTVERQHWTPRRGEARQERRPPQDHEMYRNVDQLRAESHIDTVDASFADALHSARRGALGASGVSAVAGASSARSQLGADLPPRPTEAMTRHSVTRVEALHTREISSWPLEKDKLKRGDPFHVKPVMQTGSSCVKYDIISNERKQFWY